MMDTDVKEEIGLLGEFDSEDLSRDNDVPAGERPVLTNDREGPKQFFEKPEGVPDEFWDKEKGVYKADDIYKAYQTEQQKALGLRQKLSKGFQNAPQDPSGYQIGEELEIRDEAEVEKLKTLAHKAGLSQEQFSTLLKEVSESLGEDSGHDAEEVEMRAQRVYEEEMKKLGENAPQMINNLKDWGRTLYKQGVYSEDEYKEFLNMPVSATQVMLLSKLRQASGYVMDVPTSSSTPASGDYSREEINKILASKEYDQGDPVLRKKVDEYFARMYS